MGGFPTSLERSGELADLTGRLEAVEAVQALRRALVTDNPLGQKIQQLVHFWQLVVLGHHDLALSHAATTRRAGATPSELIGVVETALITAGMPAYNLEIPSWVNCCQAIPAHEHSDRREGANRD